MKKLPDVIAEYDSTGSLIVSYTHGKGIDEIISMRRGGNSYYYFKDSLGSVTSLADDSETVVNTYRYDTFGNTYNLTGSINNPYSYVSRRLDVESGLMYFRARYYDASIGRFINADPIRFTAGINFYVYVQNNPANYIDPTGLACGPGNGLLEWMIPDVPYGFNFDPACLWHDNCYTTCGQSKSNCDQGFYQRMLAECDRRGCWNPRRYQCNVIAWEYYKAVNWFGGSAYRNAQLNSGCCN